eukprot:TRINITY_DN1462_c0_g1_i2.p1 TRINITY_DN1462_c0_g1~~TRINITY_DN1462_c0_g1_i2.p1  ORF type:complete len:389 (-),score=113.11 TRINITY_DN1462_c0_g1_i2:51-1217(-)
MLVCGGRVLQQQQQQQQRGARTCAGVMPGDTVHVVPFVAPALVVGTCRPPVIQRIVPRPGWVDGLRTLQQMVGMPVLPNAVGSGVLANSTYETLLATADMIKLVRRHIKQQASNLRANLYLQQSDDCNITPALRAAPALLAMLVDVLSAFARHSTRSTSSLARQCMTSSSLDLSGVHSTYIDTSKEVRDRKQFTMYSDSSPLPDRCLSATDLASEWSEHHHHSLPYQSLSLFHMVSVSYCLKALAIGAALVLIFTPEKNARILQSLSELGVDTKALVNSKRGFLLDNDVYMKDLDPVTGADRVREMCEHFMQESGTDQVRIVAEAQYPPQAKNEFTQKLLEYEKNVDRVLCEEPAAALCLFDSTVLPQSVLSAALHCHPTCIVSAGAQ